MFSFERFQTAGGLLQEDEAHAIGDTGDILSDAGQERALLAIHQSICRVSAAHAAGRSFKGALWGADH